MVSSAPTRTDGYSNDGDKSSMPRPPGHESHYTSSVPVPFRSSPRSTLDKSAPPAASPPGPMYHSTNPYYYSHHQYRSASNPPRPHYRVIPTGASYPPPPVYASYAPPSSNAPGGATAAVPYRFETPAYAYGIPPPLHLPATSGCTCKKSRCLKLYCQCFSSSTTCGPKCRCGDCQNTAAHAESIDDARQTILLRNPGAFDKGLVRHHHYPPPHVLPPPPHFHSSWAAPKAHSEGWHAPSPPSRFHEGTKSTATSSLQPFSTQSKSSENAVLKEAAAKQSPVAPPPQIAVPVPDRQAKPSPLSKSHQTGLPERHVSRTENQNQNRQHELPCGDRGGQVNGGVDTTASNSMTPRKIRSDHNIQAKRCESESSPIIFSQHKDESEVSAKESTPESRSSDYPRRISLASSSPPPPDPSQRVPEETDSMTILAAVAMTELLKGFPSIRCDQTATEEKSTIEQVNTTTDLSTPKSYEKRKMASCNNSPEKQASPTSNEKRKMTRTSSSPEKEASPQKKARHDQFPQVVSTDSDVVADDDDEVVRHVVSSTSIVSVESRDSSPPAPTHQEHREVGPPPYQHPQWPAAYTHPYGSPRSYHYPMHYYPSARPFPMARTSPPQFRSLPTRQTYVTPPLIEESTNGEAGKDDGKSKTGSPQARAQNSRGTYEEVTRTCGLPKSLSFRKICSRCGKTRGEHGELGFGNKCVYSDCGKCGAGIHWHELAGTPMGILCQLTADQGAIPGSIAAYDRKIRDLAQRADLQRFLDHRRKVAAGTATSMDILANTRPYM